MARPVRCRRICFEPKYDSFAPSGKGGAEQVLLTVDEFEAIRLIDTEKRTHEQCAKQMGISRTTVTEIYERARAKIADCIVNGKTLCISGGNYVLCDGSAWKCCGKKGGRAANLAETAREREENEMTRVAVTYENGNVFPHFGRTQKFKVYEIADGKVSGAEVRDTEGSGHGALAGLLSAWEVDTLICGGIGAGAQAVLAEAGIRLFGGVSGSTDEAVAALLTGSLAYAPDVHCNHHGEGHCHGEGHHCGEGKHGCAGNDGGCADH